MGTPLSTIRVAFLASAVTCVGVVPAAAAPMFTPGTPTARSDVIQVVDSAKIIHRGRLENDGGAWKKRRNHRDGREHARDHSDGQKQFRAKGTPKYAYDAYGNYRRYSGNGWDDKDRWEDRDRWENRDRWDDWDDNKRKKRPRIIKMNSFGYQEPSPALKGVLTAVPD